MACQVGVIGSGAMGSGIAQVAASADCNIVLFDNNPEALKRAQAQINYFLRRQVEKGAFSSDQVDAILKRIHFSDSIFDCQDCQLVIEAIVENLEAKKGIFEQLEDIVSQECVLASNTSSISITSIAAACQRPERVIGIHFFNPAPLMELVEVIPAVQTNDSVCDQVIQWMIEWKKTPVKAKDTPGFIVNRVARPFYGEALRILDEGLANVATIDWAMTALGGFKMGPFALMDYIGNDINYTVTETVFHSFFYDSRYKPSFTQKRLVEAGYLGKKTGRGFYNYQEGAINSLPIKDQKLGQEIVWRIVVMLINEASDALYAQIASRDDIELAMVKGVNYPKGLLHWADDEGINHCVYTLDELFDAYREERYRCSPLLRKMARSGEKFFV
ncbi:MAG TPA: 3-hydroxyacyl-CoA dehydrogenase NAD-binding domain-containing protein [Saprospiraceae bacterium]|nr:3-hydroxyacyl-CoA dehydrogenase NAD-binding domain-containing protein [Saprospiraceae bacterium]HMQ83501.1 3-hydroxyacyl-CoA dehydrogenase NAD-binding domain-containing protein [Saprospiraceae bacterium]